MSDGLERLGAALGDRYRLDRELGQGGMATVYLAHDLRHDRKVALKVLRPELAAVIGVERFLAEIRITANLQHPHILPLFDSGRTDGPTDGGTVVYYVMPFVDGESLRDRLDRETQLPIDEAVRITREVADALAAAHAVGIIHRDIKPENILLQRDHALVADFGIALAASRADGSGRMTGTGLSVGTPHYMSPEQALGERTLDARTDVYALGCVLYEMLAGQPPFTGPPQAVLARVMTESPRPLRAQRATVSDGLEAAVQCALQKLPADRFASAGAFAAALADRNFATGSGASRQDVTGGGALRRRLRDPVQVGLGILLLAAIGTAALLFPRRAANLANGGISRAILSLPDSAPLAKNGKLLVTPDGQTLIYTADLGGKTQLYRQSLDHFEAVAIPGTENFNDAFLSPDGSRIAFLTDCRGDCVLKTSALDGTGAVTVASRLGRSSGGTWGSDGRVLIAGRVGTELYLLSIQGGQVERVPQHFGFFRDPVPLPGSAWALGSVLPRSATFSAVGAVSLQTGWAYALTQRGLIRSDSAGRTDWLFGASPRLLSCGHLLYFRNDGAVMAVPFDRTGMRLLGPPVPVLAGIRQVEFNGGGQLAIAENGLVAYTVGPNGLVGYLAWISPDGRVDSLPIPSGVFGEFGASRDGKKVAYTMMPADGPFEAWLWDSDSRVTVPAGGGAWDLTWSDEEDRIYYGTPAGFMVRRSAAKLTEADSIRFEGQVAAVSRDGRFLAVSHFGATQGERTGLWVVPWDAPEQARQIDTSATASLATFSPDGNTLIFTSAEQGNFGLYAITLSGPGARRKVVDDGGEPVWSRDGKTIHFSTGGNDWKEMSAYRDGEGWRFGPPRQGRPIGRSMEIYGRGMALGPADRLLAVLGLAGKDLNQIHVTTNWLTELHRLSPDVKGR